LISSRSNSQDDLNDDIFPVLIKLSPQDLRKPQVNFGILVSKMGYSSKSVKLLERAVSIIYASGENLEKTKEIFERKEKLIVIL